MNRSLLILPLAVLGMVCFVMGIDTFWQVYFALQSQTFDAQVIEAHAETWRGSRGRRIEKLKLVVRWTNEQGQDVTGTTHTEGSAPIQAGQSVRIQYAAGTGLIRLASHQTMIGPTLFGGSLLGLIGLTVLMCRAYLPATTASETASMKTNRDSERPPQRKKTARSVKRLRPLDPDADR